MSDTEYEAAPPIPLRFREEPPEPKPVAGNVVAFPWPPPGPEIHLRWGNGRTVTVSLADDGTLRWRPYEPPA